MQVAFEATDLVQVAHADQGRHRLTTTLDNQVLTLLRLAHELGQASSGRGCHRDDVGLERDEAHGVNCTVICTVCKRGFPCASLAPYRPSVALGSRPMKAARRSQSSATEVWQGSVPNGTSGPTMLRYGIVCLEARLESSAQAFAAACAALRN